MERCNKDLHNIQPTLECQALSQQVNNIILMANQVPNLKDMLRHNHNSIMSRSIPQIKQWVERPVTSKSNNT